mmetsp:Transcript_49264/g.97084  ORF Transcript_49264/g.97084 Transcript_49264/m.97084 type:complete len:201 (-) Transcript_49264:520-1122(-)
MGPHVVLRGPCTRVLVIVCQLGVSVPSFLSVCHGHLCPFLSKLLCRLLELLAHFQGNPENPRLLADLRKRPKTNNPLQCKIHVVGKLTIEVIGAQLLLGIERGLLQIPRECEEHLSVDAQIDGQGLHLPLCPQAIQRESDHDQKVGRLLHGHVLLAGGLGSEVCNRVCPDVVGCEREFPWQVLAVRMRAVVSVDKHGLKS